MAVKSKTQIETDIAALGSTYDETAIETVLTDMVDSYEDIFSELTTAQRDALTPTTGLIIYNTDEEVYQYWNTSEWKDMSSGLNSPMTVKVDLSSADLLALYTTPKELVTAPSSGYSYQIQMASFRFIYGSVVYDYSASLFIYMNGKTRATDNFMSIGSSDMNAAANRSGNIVRSMSGVDSLAENAAILIGAGTADPSQGDGTLSIYLTYSLIVW